MPGTGACIRTTALITGMEAEWDSEWDTIRIIITGSDMADILTMDMDLVDTLMDIMATDSVDMDTAVI